MSALVFSFPVLASNTCVHVSVPDASTTGVLLGGSVILLGFVARLLKNCKR